MGLNFNKEGAAVARSFFLNQNFTEAGTYGMLANIFAESNFYPNNLQNAHNNAFKLTDEVYTRMVDRGEYSRDRFIRDSAGYGLCQWTFWTRKQELYDYAKSLGASIGDMSMQLAYIMQELKVKYRPLLEELKRSKDIEYCAKLVMTQFERPADQSIEAQNKRANYALLIRKAFVADADLVETRMKLALSPGHGLYTAGKRCMKKLDSDQTREWALNDRVADYVIARLAPYPIDILRLDDPVGATDIPVKTRAAVANNWGADLGIDIHHNAGIYGGTGGGIVVFYYSNKEIRLAQANTLYDMLIEYTQLAGNRAKPVSKKGYYMLKNTKMPWFLCELGFMDSATDVPIILSDEHARKCADAIVQFVLTIGCSEGFISELPTAVPTIQHYPACKAEHTSIIAALREVGEDGSKSTRAKIAVKNGIVKDVGDYSGTYSQNIQMLKMLKEGKLMKL